MAETDFGYRRVEPEEHARLVRGVFDSVASKYDLMNDLMSGGLHRAWKATLMNWLNPRPGHTLVDLAAGTGDIAIRFMRRVGGNGVAILCDANESMLRVAVDRGLDAGIASGMRHVVADAADLPLARGIADHCTIAFGLRNVTRRADALAEARRILAPGGHFLCLEFSHVVVPVLRELYDVYSHRVLPALGQIVAGDREAYQYLVESIRRFPDQPTLAREIADAGFANVSFRNLSAGIVAIHSGWRI